MIQRSLFDPGMRFQRRLRLSRRIRDAFWVNAILDAQVWPLNLRVDKAGNLVLPDLSLSLTKGRHEFFLPQIAFARQAAAEKIIQFSNDSSGALLMTAAGITLEIAGPTDFPLFEEVVVRHIYHVRRPGPLIVWDIGFNVGATSLYYAAQPDVVAVYAYEPLPVAYQQGLKNLSLNPHLAEKIKVFPYGIGLADESLEIGYAAWALTSAGAYGMMTPAGRQMPEETQATIALRAAADVLSEIRRAHPDTALLVKMDCEGSEKDIIPALHASSQLGDIDMAIIETHFSDASDIVQLLSESGFQVFNPQATRDIGMIYAIHR